MRCRLVKTGTTFVVIVRTSVPGGFIATLADYLLGLHPLAMVENGVASFNGSLVGTVLPALFHLVSGERPTPHSTF